MGFTLADKRLWLLFAILSAGVTLTFGLLYSSSDVTRSRDNLKQINQLILSSQQLRIQYGLTKDAIATFMFLGSDEAWDDVQKETTKLRSLTKSLTESNIDLVKQYDTKAADIEKDINSFIDKLG